MIKHLLNLLLFTPVLLSGQAYISPELQQEMNRYPDQSIRILVTLQQQVNVDSLKTAWFANPLPYSERPGVLLAEMDQVCGLSQREIISFLNHQQHDTEVIRELRIVNMLALQAHPSTIAALAGHAEVRSIVLDKSNFSLIEPVSMDPESARAENGSEPGLAVIGAREMWNLGYTGRGRMAYSVDTGIWPNHPAIKNQWKGNRFPLSETWLPWDRLTPGDKSSSHGTHTTGTILGLDSLTNDTIGVAFNAYFIATDPVVSNLADVRPLSDYVYVYEWCLNPDGDPETTDDIPDAINNSWGRQPGEGASYCDEDVAQVYEILELAGIANLSSAGNEGPAPQTMSVPHNISINEVNGFTVGSVNGNVATLPISEFSSRGPGMCGGDGSLLIKPEVVAPGQSVRSCVNQDEYAVYSGTSMACPHAVGAVLLLKEAFPYLPGKDLLEALYYSASDLGEAGEDNTYGNGIINVFAAYNYLILQGNTPVPANSSPYDLVITEILSPAEGAFCINSFQPQFHLKNAGTSSISGFQISYGIVNEIPETFGSDITLAPGEEILISLPEFSVPTTGNIEFLIRAEPIEDFTEIDVLNNQKISRFTIKDQIEVPFTETFEYDHFDLSVWHSNNPDNSMTWEIFTLPELTEILHTARINLYSYSPRASQEDDLVGPPILLSGQGAVFLDFDVAYQKRNGPDFTLDTLSVWIATDCELSDLQEVYRKGGEDLSSYDISTHDFVPESDDQWRHESIDISEFAGEAVIIPVFRSTNRKGNNLYIDNIAVYQDFNPLSVEKLDDFDAILFPNPADELVNIRVSGIPTTSRIMIFDSMGRQIHHEQFQTSLMQLDVSDYAPGIYLVRIEQEEFSEVLRLVVN